MYQDCSISLRDVEVLSYETHLLAIHPETSEFQPVNNVSTLILIKFV